MAGSSSHLVRRRGKVLITGARVHARPTVRNGVWLAAAALALVGLAGCQRTGADAAGLKSGAGGQTSEDADRTLAEPLLSVERSGLEVRSWLTPADATSTVLMEIAKLATRPDAPTVVPSDGVSVWQRAGLRVAVVQTAELAELERRLRRSDISGAGPARVLSTTPSLQRVDELWLDPGAVFRPVFTGPRSGGPVTIGLHDSRWRAGDGSPRLMARGWIAPGGDRSPDGASWTIPAVLDVQLALQWADAPAIRRADGASTDQTGPTMSGRAQNWREHGLVFSRLGLATSLPAGWSMVIWPDLTPAMQSSSPVSDASEPAATTGRVIATGAGELPSATGRDTVESGLGPQSGPGGLFAEDVIPFGEALLRQRRAAGDRAVVLILSARAPATFQLLPGGGSSQAASRRTERGRTDPQRDIGR
ncbi:MAG: hypothetical protein LW650_01200 [Planctomycetaceae bacterium]|jgi:hypothetical protein|nr:hypothetical protein [Planctomycetaceae bacterium]